MFDGFKMQLPNSMRDSLLQNELLEFKGKYSLATGEIESDVLIAVYPKNRKIDNLKFVIKNSYVEVVGSFHKYWQNGTNYQDYSFNDFKATINDLESKFGINPKDAIIHNIEIGLNIELEGITATELIQNCMIYKNKGFDLETYGSNGILKRVVLSQYEVKIYDKGTQNRVGCNLVRIEKKVKRMQKLGSVKLIDLLSPKFILDASNNVLDLWENVILFEPELDKEKLSKPQKALYTNWGNPNYLIKLALENKRKFEIERISYKNLVKAKCKLSIHNQVSEKILDKLIIFENEAQKVCTKLQLVENEKPCTKLQLG